jgi:glycosyltransferase involved in cell wall biosynthesis
MRLLLTADNIGGVWTFVLNLARGLSKNGADVRIAVIGDEMTPGQQDDIDFTKWYFFKSKQEWMRDPWMDIREAGKWLLSLADSIRADVVHLNSYSFGSLPWKVPVIITAHSCVLSWWESVNRSSVPKEWDEYTRRVTQGIRAADVVVTPSYDMMKSVEKFYHPSGKKLVIYNGAETSNYLPGNKDDYVFCMGRLWDEAKNMRLILKAAEGIKHQIYIAGKTAELSVSHPPNVQLLGQLSPHQVAGWLSGAAVYVLPVRYEPFGYTFLEAALSGCALVTGDIPSMREIWADAAVYADPDKSDSLSRIVNVLMSVTEWRRHLAMKAYTRAVSEYDSDKMLSRYNLLYNNLINIGAKRLIKYQEQ